MRFRGTVDLHGKTATGIRVPKEVVDGLASGKRPAVRVVIGTHTYRSTVTPRGGEYLLPVSAENRAEAGVSAGDEVDVDLVLDTEPRVVSVPPDLVEALASDPDARGFFDGLSYSHQLAYVVWVEQAKRAETRRSRIDRTVAMLGQGRRRG